jgi:Na+/H+ antiporter NhaD/arsenite permease-like protein
MIWIVVIFVIGYALITLEHNLHINKAATALVAGVLCWTVFALNAVDVEPVVEQLTHHLSEISAILFFLLAAMTIVEIIDMHDGFDVIVSRIQTNSQRKLFWIIALLAFFLSSILDNLTATIVLVSFLRKLVPDKQERFFFAGIVVVAANAGGAFTPIGDVTTTMLWIGGQVTTGNIIQTLFLPSVACLLIPLIYLSLTKKGTIEKRPAVASDEQIPLHEADRDTSVFERRIVLILGVASLVFVPVFKTITHLPPYMGVLLGLGVLWTVIEIIHKRKEEHVKNKYSVLSALKKVDSATVLFFLGILLSVGAMQSAGQLASAATFLSEEVGNFYLINFLVGLFSSIVDNVPLVAAMMRMYGGSFATDHSFWEFLAYCAGTGGSVLIIGSAAGVAVMGMEKIPFGWYLRKISLLALAGYIAGASVYMIQLQVFRGGGESSIQAIEAKTPDGNDGHPSKPHKMVLVVE